jgi:glycosyltransferase 2 family protein
MNARSLLIVMLLVVVMYGGFVFFNDVHKLREALSHFAWSSFVVCLALAAGNYVLRFFKWQYYLARLDIQNVPWRESLTIFLAGFAMSITPAKAGEVFKSALLASARGIPVARTAPVVIADRLTDLISLIMIAAVGSFWFEGGKLPAMGASVMVVGLLTFVFVPSLGEAVIRVVERFPVGSRLAPKAREAYAALRVLAGPTALIVPTLISLVAWGLEAFGLWVVLRGLEHTVSVAVSFFAYSVATVAGAVMMLPGGVGGTEATMETLLLQLSTPSMPRGVAAAATLLVRFATLWFAVIVGFIALAIFRRFYDRNEITKELAENP